ncbi:MAG: DUF1816 domain-containing protein [Cyanobacteria bacterium J055]|nr:MAG: DUF1816 domain-containing protein [Cyanobacteria bacterium J055]
MNRQPVMSRESWELGWWVEIATAAPSCTYDFGPFECESSAKSARGGYVEDLESEGARGIVVRVKKCQPRQLTLEVEDSQKRLGSLTLFDSVFNRFRL